MSKNAVDDPKLYFDLQELLGAYDLLRDAEGTASARALVADYGFTRAISVVTDGEDNPIGVAVAQHIRDPYDVQLRQEPCEDLTGNYLYFPVIYIKPENRSPDGKVLRQLLEKCRSRAGGIPRRYAFLRNKQLRILPARTG